MFLETNQTEIDVVVAGVLCLDLLPVIQSSFSQFSPGRLVTAHDCVISPGGPVSNTSFALQRMGLNVVPVANIGADVFGDLLLSQLQGLDTTHIQRCDYPTSYTIVIAPPDFERMYIHNSGANDYFNEETIDYSLINKSKILHFGYPPLMRSIYQNNGDVLKNIFSKSKALISLDMSWPDPQSESGQVDWIKWLKNVLPHVDFFLPTMNEICYMLKVATTTPYSEIAKQCLDMGCKLVGIKDGENGIYAKTNGIQNWEACEMCVPAYSTKAVNTVGAGDVCIAGLLAGFVKGYDLETSLRISQAAGSKSVQSVNAFDQIESFDSLSSILEQK